MNAFDILRSKSSAPSTADAWIQLNNIFNDTDLCFVVTDIDVTVPELNAVAVTVDSNISVTVDTSTTSVDVLVPIDDSEVEAIQLINIDVDKCP